MQVKTIRPERTFIEKVCLLHEEFNKDHSEIRFRRMSRHLYDLYMMCSQGIDKTILKDEKLFTTIINHRFKFNRIDGIDYNKETPGCFNIIPPVSCIELWRKDYNETMSKMIIDSNKPSFDQIISSIEKLNNNLNKMQWKEIPHFERGVPEKNNYPHI